MPYFAIMKPDNQNYIAYNGNENRVYLYKTF